MRKRPRLHRQGHDPTGGATRRPPRVALGLLFIIFSHHGHIPLGTNMAEIPAPRWRGGRRGRGRLEPCEATGSVGELEGILSLTPVVHALDGVISRPSLPSAHYRMGAIHGERQQGEGTGAGRGQDDIDGARMPVPVVAGR